jgi:hypothetical protein
VALVAAVVADTLATFAQDTTSTAIVDTFSPEVALSLGVPLRTSDNLSFGAVAQAPDGEPSASELNRQLTNPVSSIWSISNQFNNFELTTANGTTTGISSL